MKSFAIWSLALFGLACAQTKSSMRAESSSGMAMPASSKAAAGPAWSFDATIIEACSCPMFCQCYFNTKPASHVGCCPPGTDPKAAPTYCRFNNVFRVDDGAYGDVALDGARFWIAGDLGGDFSQGQMNWAICHFDPSVTPAQREGILAALGALYPVKWQSFEVGADLPVEWKAGVDRSVAKLDGGKAGEVVLVRNQGMTDEPIVIHNLRYWGAPRNDGFVLMQNDVETYRIGPEPFEHKRTNGFMITVHCDSRSAAKSAAKAY
jgi:hypothetical protein